MYPLTALYKQQFLVPALPSQVTKALGVWYVFYFVITIFFCSFYLLNLVLAVVYLSYEKEMQSVEQEVGDKLPPSTIQIDHFERMINLHSVRDIKIDDVRVFP